MQQNNFLKKKFVRLKYDIKKKKKKTYYNNDITIIIGSEDKVVVQFMILHNIETKIQYL